MNMTLAITQEELDSLKLAYSLAHRLTRELKNVSEDRAIDLLWCFVEQNTQQADYILWNLVRREEEEK